MPEDSAIEDTRHLTNKAERVSPPLLAWPTADKPRQSNGRPLGWRATRQACAWSSCAASDAALPCSNRGCPRDSSFTAILRFQPTAPARHYRLLQKEQNRFSPRNLPTAADMSRRYDSRVRLRKARDKSRILTSVDNDLLARGPSVPSRVRPRGHFPCRNCHWYSRQGRYRPRCRAQGHLKAAGAGHLS